MPYKITELTGHQKSQIPGWVEKWTKIGLCTDEADWGLSKKSIWECYRFAGLEPPKAYIKVSNPLILAISGPIASKLLDGENYALKNVRQAVQEAVWRGVEDAVREAVWQGVEAVWRGVEDAVQEAVGEAVAKSVQENVWQSVQEDVGQDVRQGMQHAVWQGLGHDVGYEMWQGVRQRVEDAVREAVWQGVRQGVGQGVSHDIKNHILENWSRYFGGQTWVSWQAFESFFYEVCGLDNDKKPQSKAYRDAQSSSFWWYPEKDFVMVCDRPRHIHTQDGRLHHPSRLAVEFRDGWGIAAWKGTVVPNEWVVGKKPTAKELLAWENIEQRRAGFEMVGWASLVDELGAVTLDKDEDPQIGELLEITVPDSGRERFLKVQCGTGRLFVIPVDPSCNSAIEAQAWSFGFNVDDFIAPEVRT